MLSKVDGLIQQFFNELESLRTFFMILRQLETKFTLKSLESQIIFVLHTILIFSSLKIIVLNYSNIKENS